jgi:uncharacterized coiled-coil protein SlyX
VAHLFDNAHDETEDLREPAPGRRRWLPIAVVAGLVMLGATSALLWRAWGGDLPALPSFASGAAPAEVADKTVGLKDFQAFQQQIAATMQSTAQLVAAQQAELKRLSDQLAALNTKIDALQRPAASPQAAVPAPPPPPPSPSAARKKSAAPKQPPGISVGGAPLPPTDR